MVAPTRRELLTGSAGVVAGLLATSGVGLAHDEPAKGGNAKGDPGKKTEPILACPRVFMGEINGLYYYFAEKCENPAQALFTCDSKPHTCDFEACPNCGDAIELPGGYGTVKAIADNEFQVVASARVRKEGMDGYIPRNGTTGSAPGKSRNRRGRLKLSQHATLSEELESPEYRLFRIRVDKIIKRYPEIFQSGDPRKYVRIGFELMPATLPDEESTVHTKELSFDDSTWFVVDAKRYHVSGS